MTSGSIRVDPAAFDAYYFSPQRMTKIMNEGWASFWHSRLLTDGILDPSEILDFVVSDEGGRPVRVSDVATVVYGFEDESTRSRLNGRTAVSLTVEKRTGANILDVASAVQAEVDRTREALPPTAEIRIVTDQSIDIRDMNADLENNILSGLLLVVVVLVDLWPTERGDLDQRATQAECEASETEPVIAAQPFHSAAPTVTPVSWLALPPANCRRRLNAINTSKSDC